MLNTPITPPRVPIIDPRTNLIDRAWYMFFLSLFQSVTTNANIPDVGPSNTAVQDQVGEIAKALQSALVGPTNSALLEQIAALRNEIQSFYLVPLASTGVTSIANGGTGASSFAAAGLPTLTGDNTFSGNNQITAVTYYTTNGTGGTNAYLIENSGFAFLNGVNGVVTAFNGAGITVTQATGFRPWSDNAFTLGTSIQRWSEVYAANGTINTSDATEKQQIRPIDDAERRTAQRIKGLIRAFKWNEAVELKGDGARIHFGVMAQDVEAAFAAEGLDASKYGLFCRDTWDTLDGPPQTRLGVRYEELLAFVIGSL